MGLYGNVLRPKKRMADDMAEVRRMGANPAGMPAPQPGPQAMAFGGAPASIGQARPRQPGSVAPTPVTSRVGQQIAPPGFSGPRQPSSPMQPAPTPTPTVPPPVEAPGTAVTGTTSATPPPPATADDIDQMIRDFVSGQLAGAGKANTAEEEALIRQQMQGEMGQSLVNQRARMGRAGFGASGAMAGIEGDVRRAAEMDALDQILGLRRGEDQRSIENAQGAISVENQMRRGAADDALRRMALEALQAEMGLDGEPAGGGTGAPPAAVVEPIMDAVGAETQAPATATAGGGRQVVAAPPAGYELYQTLSNGDQLWKSPSDPGDNSTIVVVKRGA